MANLITIWHNDTDTWSIKRGLIKELYFAKSSNQIQVLSKDGAWINTGLTEPLTKLDYETHGMSGISSIQNAKWEELDEEFEILVWTDEKDGSKFLELTTDEFSPMEKLNQEEEFEILTYSDKYDIVEKQKESTGVSVDEGKLFKTTLEDFIDITGVELV